jgi:hypothetical protein
MTTIETKEIGISFDVGQGRFVNTEVLDGSLRLKKVGGSSDLYEKTGYWESKVIDTVDKFREYDKIAVTKVQFTKDLYKIETRTSDDNVKFGDYIALSVGGNVLSPKKRYIQIKITLYAGLVDETTIISNFNSPTDKDLWEDNTFIETDGALKLKRNYQYNMTKDASWTEAGTLLRQPIQATKFKRIDTLNIE